MSSVSDIAVARQRKANADQLRYLPGVAPFDPANPVHIRAWNTLHQLGWADQRWEEREGRCDD